MSKILNESPVYPGWEVPKSEMFAEEKALLMNSKQNYIFSFVKVGASIGVLTSAYIIINKYNINEEQFNLSAMLTLIAFNVFAAGLISYLLGMVLAKLYKK